MNYRASYQGRLYRVSFEAIVIFVSNLTVETKENSQLLEASRSKESRCQCNFVLREVLHDLLDTFHILGVFLIIRFVPCLNLFFLLVSIETKSVIRPIG